MNFCDLLPATLKDQVRDWVRADVPSFDVGGFVVGDTTREALLFCKSSGVLAGVPFAKAAFDIFPQIHVDWLVKEGVFVDCSDHRKIIVARVRGPCSQILLAERVVLNILSRASGVATRAKQSVSIAQENGWHGWIAGTRKTTPGFKDVEKYALIVGGAATHRMDLSQMVMLKDNHINSAGSITSAVRCALRGAGFSMKIEVECQSAEEALEAAAAGADIVMLDNLLPDHLHAAAARVKERFPGVLVEASGGITPSTLPLFMGPHVDIISQGALTQGYACVDFSLKIQPPSAQSESESVQVGAGAVLVGAVGLESGSPAPAASSS